LTIIILQARFDIDSVNVYKGLSIVPSKMLSLTRDGIDWIEEFKTVATFYYDDLPNPLALDAELSLWDTYWTTFDCRLGRFTGFSFFSGFILKPVCFGLAFTKTGKPSLPNCLLSSPETRS
jgi:hypothetical protein